MRQAIRTIMVEIIGHRRRANRSEPIGEGECMGKKKTLTVLKHKKQNPFLVIENSRIRVRLSREKTYVNQVEAVDRKVSHKKGFF